MEEETEIQKINSLGKNIRCRNQHLKPNPPFPDASTTAQGAREIARQEKLAFEFWR